MSCIKGFGMSKLLLSSCFETRGCRVKISRHCRQKCVLYEKLDCLGYGVLALTLNAREYIRQLRCLGITAINNQFTLPSRVQYNDWPLSPYVRTVLMYCSYCCRVIMNLFDGVLTHFLQFSKRICNNYIYFHKQYNTNNIDSLNLCESNVILNRSQLLGVDPLRISKNGFGSSAGGLSLPNKLGVGHSKYQSARDTLLEEGCAYIHTPANHWASSTGTCLSVALPQPMLDTAEGGGGEREHLLHGGDHN